MALYAEQFSFPHFDLILPGPGRCGFLTAPDLHKKNTRTPNNLLKLNDSDTHPPNGCNLVEKVLCYYYNSTSNLYQINLIRRLLI